MTGLFNDIRHSAKSFARTPGLALALLFSIAIGIGSNVVVHGFIRGLIVRHSPLTEMGRIVSLFEREARGPAALVSYNDFVTIRNQAMFEWVGAAREFRESVELPGRSDVMTVSEVTRDLVGPLNLELSNGVVISYRLWRDEFDGASDIHGERILVGGFEMPVDGVAPDWLDGLYFGRPVDLWMPLREGSLQGIDRTSRSLWVLGRLQAGISINPMQALMPANRADSGVIHAYAYTKIPPEMTYGLSQVGMVLTIAAGIVFLIACGNVAAFLVGRASVRAHQTSIRVALGAGRGHLARQLLSESMVISLAGGALGTMLAVWTSQIFPALFFEQDAEQLAFAQDPYNVLSSFVVCAGITNACGLMPLFEIRLHRPANVLRRERSGGSKAIRLLRAGLVIAQMTCCCVLMISTGLLFEGLRRGLETSTGHRLGRPAFATVQASPGLVAQYRHLRYFQDVEQSARSQSGAFGTAWAQTLPGNRPMWQSLRIEPPPSKQSLVTLDSAIFALDSPPLFELPVRAGRMFGGADTAQTCRVAIVNEEAQELFGGDAVGRAIEDSMGQRVDIIGVVSSHKAKGRIQTRSRPAIYFYGEQEGSSYRIRQERFRVADVAALSRAVLDANVVSSTYFDTMGLSLITGQNVAEAPSARDCRVGVVNREAAELYFGGNAVGAAVIDDLGRRTEIIGVVHSAPLGTFQPRVEPAVYFQMSWDCPPQMRLILLTREPTEAMLDAVRRQIEAIPGRGPAPIVVKTLETHFNQTALAPLRIATVIMGACTGMALVLSVLGLYGALTDAARQRGRELAVRVALGAQRRHVIFQVLREGGRLAAAGTVIGMSGSLLLLRYLSQFSGGSPPLWIWLSAPFILAVAVAVAGLLPARSALMVDPLQIMRDE